MEESLIYSNVACELLEIFKYFDKELKEKIPEKLKESLERISNKEHKFRIDKTKELKEQELLPQTKDILSVIYLKYCCTLEERESILQEMEENQRLKELEKYEKYNPNDIFKNREKQVIEEPVQLINVQDIPWYRKILGKISEIFKNIFRKQGI